MATPLVLSSLQINGGTLAGGTSAYSGFIPILNGSGQLDASFISGSSLSYQGTWNANTNTPTLTSSVGTAGYYYVVATAGTTTLNGISVWNIGDWAIFNGSTWQKIDGVASEVISVAGRTGAVTLTSADLTDATTLGKSFITIANTPDGIVNVANGALSKSWTIAPYSQTAAAGTNVSLTAGSVSSAGSSLGGNLTLQAGSVAGYTNLGSGGGVVTIMGGNATGSGGPIGGGVIIDSGSGTAGGGTITIGGLYATGVTIGNGGNTVNIGAAGTLVTLQGQQVNLNGSFTTSGNNSLILTTTGGTNVTLPTSGTLATTANLVNSYSTLSISAAGNNNLTRSEAVNAVNVTLGAGSGTYTASISLTHTNAVAGDLFELTLSIPASTNPTLTIYDTNTSGTLLSTVTSNGVAGVTTLSFFYSGTAWVLFPKGAALNYKNLSDLQSASTARTNLGLGTLATLNSVNNSNWSGTVLSTSNGGTGTASPGLTAGTNITITGTWPNNTINASGVATSPDGFVNVTNATVGNSWTVAPYTGSSSPTGTSVNITGGSTNYFGTGIVGGAVNITGSAQSINVGTAAAGAVNITGGAGTTGLGCPTGGIVTIAGGASQASTPGNVVITGGASSSNIAGNVVITGGASSNSTCGNVVIDGGMSSVSSGFNGSVTIGTTNALSTTIGNGTNPTTLNGNVSVGSHALTLAGAFTTSGANALTLTTTGSTNVTLPTSGTLITSSSLYGANASTTVSAAGTTNLTSSGPINSDAFTANAGSGAYTANITLSTTGAVTGANYDIYVNIAASANPTVKVYNNTTGGTLLSTIAGTAAAATSVTLSYFYNGTAWVLYPTGSPLTINNLSDLQSSTTARTNLGLTGFATLSTGTDGIANVVNGTAATGWTVAPYNQSAANGTAVSITGGSSTQASGTGGNITIQGGNLTQGNFLFNAGNASLLGGTGAGGGSTGGNAIVDGGTGLTNGVVYIGTTNAKAVTIGSSLSVTGVAIYGTNNASAAAAGYVGEIITSKVATGSAVSLSNITAKNITSISLTAGDWDVSGNVNFNASSATVTQYKASIGTTTATINTDGTECYSDVQFTTTTATNSITIPTYQVNVSSTTTVYLVGYAAFSAGTMTGFGSITARRRR